MGPCQVCYAYPCIECLATTQAHLSFVGITQRKALKPESAGTTSAASRAIRKKTSVSKPVSDTPLCWQHMLKAELWFGLQNSTAPFATELSPEGTEEVNELSQSMVSSTNRPKGTEDVLESHRKRIGADKKAPSPLAVAQFREGLEKTDRVDAVADKSPAIVRRIEGDSASVFQSTANANSNVFSLSTISSSAKKRGPGQSQFIAFT